MNHYSEITVSINTIRQKAPNFIPKVGIILGSGVGHFVNRINDATTIPYESLVAMRPCTVEGHAGLLHLGTIHNVPIACFQGRNHFYEGYEPKVIQAPVRLLKLLGATTLILVSAAGSISSEIPIGSLALINDHINFQLCNPLIGQNDNRWGPRFPDMEHVYDQKIRQELQQIAAKKGIQLKEGVYIGVLGPSFETPAEIRAFKILGADLVGMSTIPEVITAKHCGIKVGAIAVVTNMAAGIESSSIDHQISLAVANKAVENISQLLEGFMDVFC